MSDFRDTQLGPEHDFPEFAGETRDFVLAGTQRTGSHMLGLAMRDTGALGCPLEYANNRNVGLWAQRFGTGAVADTLAAVKRHRTSPNGVFGIKMHYAHLRNLGGAAALEELFPGARFVLLSRRDVLGQAVSYSRAKQTDVWMNGAEAAAEPRFDAKQIDAAMRRFLRHTAAWRFLLAKLDVPHLEFAYEDVVRDLPGTVRAIADFLEVDLPARPIAAPTARQRDALNDEWRARYLRERPGSLELFSRRPWFRRS